MHILCMFEFTFGAILCFVDEFRQGTEYNMMTLMNLRKAQTIAKVGQDKTSHTVKDLEANEGTYWQMILFKCV